MSKAYQSTFTGETNTPYSKQFVHSKSSQYRRLKTEWKNNVYLARSRIQGLGLYAAKDIEKHTMVIEYIGTIIRNEVANRREKIYEEQVRLCWDAGGLCWGLGQDVEGLRWCVGGSGGTWRDFEKEMGGVRWDVGGSGGMWVDLGGMLEALAGRGGTQMGCRGT